MRRFLFISFLAACATAVVTVPRATPAAQNAAVAVRPPTVETLRTAWEQYVVARKRFEDSLYRFCTRTWPDLETQIQRERDRRLARLEMRNVMFAYVVRTDPDRIRAGNSVRNLASFAWSSAEADSLASHNPLYAQLRTLLATLDRQAAADPRTGELFERLQSAAGSPAFLRIRRPFNEHIARLDSTLRAPSRTRAPAGD